MENRGSLKSMANIFSTFHKSLSDAAQAGHIARQRRLRKKLHEFPTRRESSISEVCGGKAGKDGLKQAR